MSRTYANLDSFPQVELLTSVHNKSKLSPKSCARTTMSKLSMHDLNSPAIPSTPRASPAISAIGPKGKNVKNRWARGTGVEQAGIETKHDDDDLRKLRDKKRLGSQTKRVRGRSQQCHRRLAGHNAARQG